MRLTRRKHQPPTPRPNPNQTPTQQLHTFLQAPGQIHIVTLPNNRQFVIKVTDQEMPIFTTICLQLRAVLGHCEATPATPITATPATTQTTAHDTAQQTLNHRNANHPH